MGVHEGHAFIVEAAVSVGGKNIKPGLNIHRFANRIPLLFEVGSAACEAGGEARGPKPCKMAPLLARRLQRNLHACAPCRTLTGHVCRAGRMW